MKLWLALAGVLLTVAAPVSAQSKASAADDSAEVAVQYALLHFNEFAFSKAGFDVNYASKLLTQPASSLGLRAGFVVEGGLHHFDGGSLKLIQGGVKLVSTRLGTPRFRPYGHIMFGIGNFEGTDTIMSLMPGADITLEGHPYHLRVEAGQVWDFFGGGHQVAWRYSVGLSMPLGAK
ncbi:MAG: hypothetical protein ABI634_10935 [Acidobacteriota bacterium]